MSIEVFHFRGCSSKQWSHIQDAFIEPGDGCVSQGLDIKCRRKETMPLSLPHSLKAQCYVKNYCTMKAFNNLIKIGGKRSSIIETKMLTRWMI